MERYVNIPPQTRRIDALLRDIDRLEKRMENLGFTVSPEMQEYKDRVTESSRVNNNAIINNDPYAPDDGTYGNAARDPRFIRTKWKSNGSRTSGKYPVALRETWTVLDRQEVHCEDYYFFLISNRVYSGEYQNEE